MIQILNELSLEERKNMTKIEFINIFGLFGRYDIKLSFEKNANIYIGENGMGKTTILNCIYFLLEKKFSKLAEINFESIEIKFKNESKTHNITIYDLNKFNLKRLPRKRVSYIDEEIIAHTIDEVLGMYSDDFVYSEKMFLNEQIDLVSRHVAKMLGIPLVVARRRVMEYIGSGKFSYDKNYSHGDEHKVEKLINSINENISEKILYLPTYRRIEDDFTKLNISAENMRESDMLIRFGMSDVQNSKNKILESIRQEAIEGFNKMTGVLLKQYAYAGNSANITRNKRVFEVDKVTLILGRIGDKIDEEAKAKILRLIQTGNIYSGEYEILLDLLEKLISSYESQKKYDDRIKLFADTCNKYLNGKKFYYNPSELTLDIYITSGEVLTTEKVELPYLSSGEKQIVSLFSKLYLENNKENIVIIDEPELSLSIKWQSMLLPDIIRSGNCKLLLTVTHSPFIFDNEFDMEAREMRKYIKFTK